MSDTPRFTQADRDLLDRLHADEASRRHRDELEQANARAVEERRLAKRGVAAAYEGNVKRLAAARRQILEATNSVDEHATLQVLVRELEAELETGRPLDGPTHAGRAIEAAATHRRGGADRTPSKPGWARREGQQ